MFCERALPLMLPWLHVPPQSLVVTCVHWYNKLHLIVNTSLIDRKCIFKMGGADCTVILHQWRCMRLISEYIIAYTIAVVACFNVLLAL